MFQFTYKCLSTSDTDNLSHMLVVVHYLHPHAAMLN